MNQIIDPEAIAHILEMQRKDAEHRQKVVLDAIASHPKRRGELRAEYTRRILRLAREAK